MTWSFCICDKAHLAELLELDLCLTGEDSFWCIPSVPRVLKAGLGKCLSKFCWKVLFQRMIQPASHTIQISPQNQHHCFCNSLCHESSLIYSSAYALNRMEKDGFNTIIVLAIMVPTQKIVLIEHIMYSWAAVRPFQEWAIYSNERKSFSQNLGWQSQNRPRCWRLEYCIKAPISSWFLRY